MTTETTAQDQDFGVFSLFSDMFAICDAGLGSDPSLAQPNPSSVADLETQLDRGLTAHE